MNKRNIIIIISSVVVASGVGYIVYTKIRNRNEINKIHASLDGNEGAYGSVEDFADVFSGTSYISNMKSKYPSLILLIDKYVSGYRKELRDAISGAGTDEDAIKSIFRKFKDRVQVAQVAESYKKYYGENLLDAIKGEMDNDETEMKELSEIMIGKPAFRLA